MKQLENDVACFYYNYNEEMRSSIIKLCDLTKSNPFSLKPFRNTNHSIKKLFTSKGFQLYPTVKKTTLFYDRATDCFFKILHPLNLKNKILFLFMDKSRAIYHLSERLYQRGVKVQRVTAYGLFTKGRRPCLAIKRAEGESLYDILIRGKKHVTMALYRKVIDEVVRLHSLGYWFGDAHLSHIFIKDAEISGLIDIDSMRKNFPYRLRNIAKDIAGLNHPELPLTKDEKKSLLGYYLDGVDIQNEEKFLRLIHHYTERRWKD